MNKKIFKYVFMLMVVLMGAVSFTACGDDGNSGSSSSDLTPTTLIGTWSDGSSNSFTFNADGTVAMTSSEGTINGTYVYDTNAKTITITGPSDSSTITVVFDVKYTNSIMTLSYGKQTINLTKKDSNSATGGSGSIYGTWKADISNTVEGTAYCTVTITSNSMDMLWYCPSNVASSEEEVYDTFSYDASSNTITAHYYKKYDYNADGSKTEKAKDATKTYYVIWIDSNHIQIGKAASDGTIKIEDDFGTLERQ